jgi:hypothetical protein
MTRPDPRSLVKRDRRIPTAYARLHARAVNQFRDVLDETWRQYNLKPSRIRTTDWLTT